MVRIDDAESIRQLAYDIWQREGCPSGREHEHWAEANRRFAASHPQEPVAPVEAAPPWDAGEAERHEIEVMRSALWTPEAYSPELFGAGPWDGTRTEQQNVVDTGVNRHWFKRNTAFAPQIDKRCDRHRTSSRA